MIVALWIFFAFIVGMGSRSDGKGFWLVFLVSLVFSPLIGLIAYLLIKKETKCTFCGATMLPNDVFCQACDRDKTGKTKEDYKANITK